MQGVRSMNGRCPCHACQASSLTPVNGPDRHVRQSLARLQRRYNPHRIRTRKGKR